MSEEVYGIRRSLGRLSYGGRGESLTSYKTEARKISGLTRVTLVGRSSQGGDGGESVRRAGCPCL